MPIKKPRLVDASSTAASSLASSAIQINIANHIPLSDTIGNRRVNVPALSTTGRQLELLNSSNSSGSRASSSPVSDYRVTPSDVEYPCIGSVLMELDRSLPGCDFTQYRSALMDRGIVSADAVGTADDEIFTTIGISEGFMDMIRDRARIMTLAAEGHGVSAPRY
jgi:hypothetical protein